MSSFNHIEKIKYTKNPADPVALQEYIFFEDSKEEEKFAVFKFVNHLNQCLRELKFEVFQYDENHDLLEKSVLVYDDFVSKPNATFVPNAKLKTNFACKSLKVNLVYAAFDRVKWEKGEFSDNSYSFDRYAKESASAPVPAVRAAEAVKAPAKTKSKDAGVKNELRKNIAVFPKVFSVFLCLAVIVFVVVTMLLFRDHSSVIYIDGFDLIKVSDNRVNICGYDGTERALTIPATVGDYTVNKITEKAFENSDITSLVFETGDIVVENRAFANCKFLTEITSAETCGTIVVMENGFSDCGNLDRVTLPTAQLTKGSFSGCIHVSYLEFNQCVGTDAAFPLLQVFGDDAAYMTGITIIAHNR